MCSDRPRLAPAAGAGRRRSRRRLVALLVVLGAAGALAGCGKKGDPSPPLRYVPQTTERLTVSQRHLDLILELPYPKTTAAGMALPGLSRIEVWEVRRTAPGALDGGGEGAGEDGAEGGDEGAISATPEPAATPGGSEEAGGPVAAAGAEEPASGLEPEPEAEPAEDDAVATPASAAPGAAPTTAGGPPALDPREFLARATLRTTIEAAALSGVVIGERIVIPLPLPATFPEVPEALYLAVRTVVGEDDRSELSNQAVIVPRVPPEPPRGLAAEAGPGGVRLTWEGNGPEAIGYDVYRRRADERVFLDPIARLDAGSDEYFDSTAGLGQRYIYAVTAVAARDPAIESAVGSTVEIDYRDLFAPAPPAGLVALVEEGRVRLVWEAAEADDLVGYAVERASDGGAFEPVGEGLVTGSEWIDTTVAAGTTYTWRVVSVDDDGNRSTAAEVTTEAR